MTDDAGRYRRWLAASGITMAGAALFIQAVRAAGASTVIDGLRHTGWGFLLIIALSVVRQFVRAIAWTWCVEAPARLPIRDAFAASVTGDAVGNLTPFGPAISEPTKALWVKNSVSLVAGGAALTIENLIYTVSVLLVFLLGTLLLPVALHPAPAITIASVALLAVITLALAAIVVPLLRKSRFISDTLAWLARRGILRRALEPRIAGIRDAEDLIHGFAGGGLRRIARVGALETLYHVSAVAEVWATLALIGVPVTMLVAFILEYVNRVITVLFKFMPMRLGVDEAGSGVATSLLGLGTPAGVTLAIVRKGRILCWTVLGLVFLSVRQFSRSSISSRHQGDSGRVSALEEKSDEDQPA